MDDVRKLWIEMLLATATTLEAFQVSVGAATHLFDHDAEMTRMAENATDLAEDMRDMANRL